MNKWLGIVATIMMGITVAQAKAAEIKDPENTLLLDLKDGRVVIELLPAKAPNHVKRIKELTRQKFYDGIVFHRVIDGFMAQTGDPTGTGMGGSGQKLKAEFNNEPHGRGAVSMARAMDPDSADSQFFIVLKDSNFLDNQYTVWGRVIEGMEFVDNIKKGDSGNNGSVSSPDKIVKMQIAADSPSPTAAKKAEPLTDTPAAAPAAVAPVKAPADATKDIIPSVTKEEAPVAPATAPVSEQSPKEKQSPEAVPAVGESKPLTEKEPVKLEKKAPEAKAPLAAPLAVPAANENAPKEGVAAPITADTVKEEPKKETAPAVSGDAAAKKAVKDAVAPTTEVPAVPVDPNAGAPKNLMNTPSSAVVPVPANDADGDGVEDSAEPAAVAH